MRNTLILLSILIFSSVAYAAGTDDIFSKPREFVGTDGASIYRQNCQACHMPDAVGVHTGVGMYPALKNSASMQMPEYITMVVLNGLRGMPSFDSDFTDAQVAAIANYVTTNFGNKNNTAITVEEVRAMRPNPPVVYED